MRINRGPPGYKIIRAPFSTCETYVSINEQEQGLKGKETSMNLFQNEC